MTLYRCVAHNRHGRVIVEQIRDILDLDDGGELRSHVSKMLATKSRKLGGGDKLAVYTEGTRPRKVKEVTF